MAAQQHRRRARLRSAVTGVQAAALAVVLVLSGCGGGDVDEAAPTSTATTTASPPTSEEPTPTSAPAATSARPSPTPTPSAPATTSVEPAPTAPPPTRPGPTPTPVPTSSPRPTVAPPTTDLVGAWRGVDVETFPTDRRVVALTFDGGASDTAVASILGTLADEGVPATFFVTGAFARSYPDSVRAMARAGHPVGNHSDSHPSFPQSTNEEIRAELRAAEASISALTGTTTQPLFRFPFGDRTPLDIEVVNVAGYVPVRWTVDTLGWQGTTEGISTAVVRRRVVDTVRPGQVVLMHVGAHPQDGSTLDADALPGMIDDLRALGYGFTTVPDLLAEGR